MPRQVHINLTMPGDLWKELQDHVSEKKTQNSEASASGIIRGLVRDFLKKKRGKARK
jgi:hypothetical protein